MSVLLDWRWLPALYLFVSFMVCIAALSDLLGHDQGPDFRWYHVVRAFAFCIFLAPGFMCFWTVRDLLRHLKTRLGWK